MLQLISFPPIGKMSLTSFKSTSDKDSQKTKNVEGKAISNTSLAYSVATSKSNKLGNAGGLFQKVSKLSVVQSVHSMMSAWSGVKTQSQLSLHQGLEQDDAATAVKDVSQTSVKVCLNTHNVS